jgi:hypothetical protein
VLCWICLVYSQADEIFSNETFSTFKFWTVQTGSARHLLDWLNQAGCDSEGTKLSISKVQFYLSMLSVSLNILVEWHLLECPTASTDNYLWLVAGMPYRTASTDNYLWLEKWSLGHLVKHFPRRNVRLKWQSQQWFKTASTTAVSIQLFVGCDMAMMQAICQSSDLETEHSRQRQSHWWEC